MSSDEMLVVAGGLFFGYLIVHFALNRKVSKNKNTQEKSNSSQKKTDQEDSSQKSNSQNPDKDDYVPISWFSILEVSESATFDEISLSYKRKIRQYHPDKVAALGKELRELAEFKSKQINSAYEFAKKLKS
jgi:DnaJ-domain-containing protein 1